jgi:hypothetical protein
MLDRTKKALLDRVHSYIDRGWYVVPVPYKSKKPVLDAWGKIEVTRENVGEYFPEKKQHNVGGILSPDIPKPLTDVDVDVLDALAIAARILPPTNTVFGRQSKPKSHYLYYGEGPAPRNVQIKDDKGAMIIELRTGGGDAQTQSILPGSVHSSGELVEWHQDGEPETYEYARLEQCVRTIAAATLLARAWPKENGGRQELALTLGGFLARAEYSEQDISRFVEIVADAAGDEETDKRVKAAVDSHTNYHSGEKAVRGLPKLVELIGEKVAKLVAKILKVKKSSAPTADIGVSVDDFLAYMVEHTYIFRPTGDPWPVLSVNSRLANRDGLKANVWLDQNKHVEQMTWAPGKPELIPDTLFADGAWIPRPGVTVYNRYRPAIVKRLKGKAKPWLKLGAKLFGWDFRHLVYWMAWRVQRPDVKINHALLLGGSQGIGKDTLLEPFRKAIGEWNFKEQSPAYILESQFTGYLQSVVLRISETRDLGENFDRFAFYEHTKTLIAAPPETLTCNDKYIRAYPIINGTGVILTTNHKAQGFYLPANDRRHFVAWSDRKREEFGDQYWNELYSWYQNGGYEIVADFLWSVDLTEWNPKAPPPQTPAFWEIVQATASSEDAELADALDAMGRPDVVMLDQVAAAAGPEFRDWLHDRKNGRKIPHRFEQCDYVPVRNADAKSDGRWKIGGRRTVVYGKTELSERQRVKAAQDLAANYVPPKREATGAVTVDLVLIYDNVRNPKAQGDAGSKYGHPETRKIVWLPNAWVERDSNAESTLVKVTLDARQWTQKQSEWKEPSDQDRLAIDEALGDVEVPF